MDGPRTGSMTRTEATSRGHSAAVNCGMAATARRQRNVARLAAAGSNGSKGARGCAGSVPWIRTMIFGPMKRKELEAAASNQRGMRFENTTMQRNKVKSNLPLRSWYT
jgi:hypothetical protein